jgi:hypothetical protein
MTPTKRWFIGVGVLTGLLLLTALWSVSWMLAQRAEAQHAAADLQATSTLAAQITGLKAEPKIAAADEARGIQQLDPKIELALKAAGLPRRPTIDGIFPQAAREVGDLPYQVKPTAVSIRRVSLGQLAKFLYYLSDDTGLNVRDLRMRTARSGDARQWDAEVVLTYLIYVPSGAGP